MSTLAGLRPARSGTPLAVLAALLVWVVLLGPTITLLARVSPGQLVAALGEPGALDPLVTSVEASALALLVIVAGGTPLAYLLARRRMPLNRVVEGAVLLPLLMPPLVIGLLLVFMVGPETPLGAVLAHLHLTAADTFFALLVAEVYEAVPRILRGTAEYPSRARISRPGAESR